MRSCRRSSTIAIGGSTVRLGETVVFLPSGDATCAGAAQAQLSAGSAVYGVYPKLCQNSCEYHNDGVCDDGAGALATIGYCSLGTDCDDCEPREIKG